MEPSLAKELLERLRGWFHEFVDLWFSGRITTTEFKKTIDFLDSFRENWLDELERGWRKELKSRELERRKRLFEKIKNFFFQRSNK
jgi:hypothetical protein